MASTFFGLNIAYTGLQAAQTSINVTAQNISNINTTGYTRQEALTQAAQALRTYASYGTLGSGVVVTEIQQNRDTYYDAKYRNNQTNYGEYDVKNSYMGQIQAYLNEWSLQGYCTEYTNFFTAVNTLSLNPGEDTAKNSVINSADSLADYFNTLSTNLQNIQIDTNNEVKDAVDQINTIADSIVQLNKQINQIETNYGNANDLRDQRNKLVDDLSSIVNIDVSETQTSDNTTEFRVNINGQCLVSGYSANKLEVVARDEKRNASDANGLYDIQWKNGNTFDIYSSSLGGNLKGLIDIRDGCNGEVETIATDEDGNYVTDDDGNLTLTTESQSTSNTSYKGVPYYQAQLNEFIQTFTQQVNQILNSGVTASGDAGCSLFVVTDGTSVMSAANVTVNADLLKTPSDLAMKSDVSKGEADCDIITELYDLQNQKVFNGGTGAYFLESIVSDMSIDASKAENMEQNYTNLATTIQNQRLSIMGVDTDEEAMGLMKFQQAYNLNSKILSVMNEIYDKLINQTGV